MYSNYTTICIIYSSLFGVHMVCFRHHQPTDQGSKPKLQSQFEVVFNNP